VPVEQTWTERYFVNSSAEEREVERRERRLVHSLELHLRQRGDEVVQRYAESGRTVTTPAGLTRTVS
jgi:hypothetical protein